MLPLARIYDYFGAHRVTNRFTHERQRAAQRFWFPLTMIPAGICIGQALGLTHKGLFGLFTVLPMLYGALGLAYYFYLRRYPAGGVGAQYLFLICDPIVTEVTIAYEPAAFSWMSIMLLVIIARAGVRYGVRTLMLTWLSAICGALVLFYITSGSAVWQEAKHTYLVVCAALGLGVPLFMRVIREQSRTRELELGMLRIDSLAESIKGRDEFLSSVSHELRSPLQGIIATLELLEVRDGRVDPVSLKRLRRSAMGLSTQLTDLLTLARGQAGRLKISPSCTSVRELFVGAQEGAEEIAHEKGLVFSIELPQPELCIVVDGVRVSQIVENLLHNAVNYTEAGSVRLIVGPLDEARKVLCFCVEDTGTGIAPEHQEAIFNPYERGAGKNRGKASVGIGLAVVKTLVTNLGGTLRLESALGVGSKFFVEIPFACPRIAVADAEGNRVLIIDDREDVLVALAALAAELGYVTDVALSAGRARNLIAVNAYDTILVDLEMPVVSGVDFAKELRNQRGANASTNIVAMTAGEGEVSDPDWPFDSLVRKPISARALKTLLTRQEFSEAIAK